MNWLKTFTEDECRALLAAAAVREGRPLTVEQARRELDRRVAQLARHRREGRAAEYAARDAGREGR